MDLTTSEKIKVIAKRKGMTMKDLADKTNQSRQNLGNKLALDDWRESELRDIAGVLDCTLEVRFVSQDTGEEF